MYIMKCSFDANWSFFYVEQLFWCKLVCPAWMVEYTCPVCTHGCHDYIFLNLSVCHLPHFFKNRYDIIQRLLQKNNFNVYVLKAKLMKINVYSFVIGMIFSIFLEKIKFGETFKIVQNHFKHSFDSSDMVWSIREKMYFKSMVILIWQAIIKFTFTTSL